VLKPPLELPSSLLLLLLLPEKAPKRDLRTILQEFDDTLDVRRSEQTGKFTCSLSLVFYK
jgi:hypothetical protein